MYTGNAANFCIFERSQKVGNNGVNVPVNIVVHQSEDFTLCGLDTDHQLVTLIGQGRNHDDNSVSILLEWLDKLLDTGSVLFNSRNDDLPRIGLQPETHAFGEGGLGVNGRNNNAHVFVDVVWLYGQGYRFVLGRIVGYDSFVQDTPSPAIRSYVNDVTNLGG